MKVLLAPDSFKGSLTGAQFCAIATRTIKQADPAAETLSLPLSDGGEGLADVLLAAKGGQRHQVLVADPLGREVLASYVLLSDRATAVIEFASASGLTRVKPGLRNALTASSFGTGQLLLAAIEAGATHLVVGLGGSASMDGGMGVLTALGFRFLDSQGRQLAAGGAALQQLHAIDVTQVPKTVWDLQFDLICDVMAPLLGPQGASQVYAPQKGASDSDVKQLELGLSRLALVIETQFPQMARLAQHPGSGAAGGAGMGLAGVLGGRINPGFDYVATMVDLAGVLESWLPDLVITGEGCVDGQTLQGKVVQGVATTCARVGVPCVVVAGMVRPEAKALLSGGVSRMISLTGDGMSENEVIQQVAPLLQDAIREVIGDCNGPAKENLRNRSKKC